MFAKLTLKAQQTRSWNIWHVGSDHNHMRCYSRIVNRL